MLSDRRDSVKQGLGRLLFPIEPAFLDCPVFLVSCGRSGSTALSRGLGAHPQVLMGDEAPLLHKFGEIGAVYVNARHPEYLRRKVAVPEDRMRRELRRVAHTSVLGPGLGFSYHPRALTQPHSVLARRRPRRWGAKVFPTESAAEGLLWLFPKASFVYLFRNGTEVVASMAKFGAFTELSFEGRCRHWSDRVHRYQYLQSCDRAVVVRFEDFVADGSATFERLVASLGLDADPAPAEFTSTTLVHPGDQPTARVDARSALERRRPSYEDWTVEERRIFVDICGEAMATLGYEIPFSP